MEKYIRVSDKRYPFSIREIKQLFANTSFPTPFRAKDFEVVFKKPQPLITNLQTASEVDPVLNVLDKYEQAWEIVDKFQDDPEGLTKEEQEQNYLDNIAAQELAAQIETDNKSNLEDDELINTLKTKTMDEIEDAISDGFSALSGMSDAEIDADIDARTTMAQCRPILKALAKDVKWSVKILKVVAKIAVHVMKRVL